MAIDPDPDVRDRLAEAIQRESHVLAEQDVAVLSRWYLITEWVDGDGNAWLSRTFDADSSVWIRGGMLAFAMEWEKTGFTNDEDDDRDD